MTEEGEFYEYRTAQHQPGSEDELAISWHDLKGRMNKLWAFSRHGEDQELRAQALLHHPDTGDLIAEEVRVPGRLIAAKEVSLEFVHDHKRAIEVAGTVTVGIAAATGILVKRYRRRG